MAQRYASVLPRRLIPSRNDVVAMGMWGGTAALGGLWLTQPWGYIKALAVGDEEVEEEAKQNDEGRGQPKPPAARMGEDTKAKMEEGDEGDNDKEEGKEDGDDNGDGENNKDDDGESKKDDSKEADSKEDSKDDKKEEESGKKKE